jgi:hypothetical protein
MLLFHLDLLKLHYLSFLLFSVFLIKLLLLFLFLILCISVMLHELNSVFLHDLSLVHRYISHSILKLSDSGMLFHNVMVVLNSSVVVLIYMIDETHMVIVFLFF